MIATLIDIANLLDDNLLYKEADIVDSLIKICISPDSGTIPDDATAIIEGERLYTDKEKYEMDLEDSIDKLRSRYTKKVLIDQNSELATIINDYMDLFEDINKKIRLHQHTPQISASYAKDVSKQFLYFDKNFKPNHIPDKNKPLKSMTPGDLLNVLWTLYHRKCSNEPQQEIPQNENLPNYLASLYDMYKELYNEFFTMQHTFTPKYDLM